MPSPVKTSTMIRAALAALPLLTTGNVFYVSSTTTNAADLANTSTGRSPTAPFATLGFAVTQVKANNNDVIIVMPNHAENVTGAAGIFMDSTVVAGGYSVIGLGVGTSRPTFTWTGTASTWKITAANVTIMNILCVVSIDEVVSMWDVRGPFVTLDAVDFNETASVQAIQFLLTTAAATDLVIRNCKHYQATAAAANTLWIQIVGGARQRIHDNIFKITTTNSASSSVIRVSTAAASVRIANNEIEQLGGTAVIPLNLVAATDGIVSNNLVCSLATNIVDELALASCFGFQNFAAHVVNKSGILTPVADA